MEVRFFNREIENPVLRFLVLMGAVVFAAALVAAVLMVVIPVVGAVLTGVLLVVTVVLAVALILLPFLAFIGLLFSRGEKGSGVMKTEERVIDCFDTVKISGAFKAVITCGEGSHTVRITTDDNLLDNVRTEVSGGELRISLAKPVSSSSGLKLEISCDSLRKARVYGASVLSILNVSNDISLRASGAAKVNASGTAVRASIRISGAGKADCGELVADEVCVNLSGAGNALVHATGSLKARISGAGRVKYLGNPETVEKKISGAGSVNPA